MNSSADSAAVTANGTVEPGADDDLAELVRMSDALSRWEGLPWIEVQWMTQTMGPKILAQLIARNLWDGLTAAEQASVYWAMADGHSVSQVHERYVRTEYVGPRIASLREASDRVAVKCGPYPYLRKDQQPSSVQAAEYTRRFDALPEGWRAEVVRRAAADGDVRTAVAGASVSMNLLRSAYGIDART